MLLSTWLLIGLTDTWQHRVECSVCTLAHYFTRSMMQLNDIGVYYTNWCYARHVYVRLSYQL